MATYVAGASYMPTFSSPISPINSYVMAIDCGVRNMGCACICYPFDQMFQRPFLEYIDWRPLITTKTVGPSLIVDAIRQYVSEVTNGGKRLPNRVLIEQQVVGIRYGGNFHALEIEIALLAVFKERFSCCSVEIVRAPARKDGSGKARASYIGQSVVNKYGGVNKEKYDSMRDQQHVADSITMIVDRMNFKAMPDVQSEMQSWESAVAAERLASERLSATISMPPPLPLTLAPPPTLAPPLTLAPPPVLPLTSAALATLPTMPSLPRQRKPRKPKTTSSLPKERTVMKDKRSCPLSQPVTIALPESAYSGGMIPRSMNEIPIPMYDTAYQAPTAMNGRPSFVTLP
jgi:hypothetical protein